MTTVNTFLRNVTLTEVETSLALMIENRTFSEQGQMTLGLLNEAINNCRTIEQANNTISFVYDFDFYKTSVGVVELKMNVNQDFLEKLGVEEAGVIIWTTTPWTLPANMAICLNAE